MRRISRLGVVIGTPILVAAAFSLPADLSTAAARVGSGSSHPDIGKRWAVVPHPRAILTAAGAPSGDAFAAAPTTRPTGASAYRGALPDNSAVRPGVA